MSRKRSKKQTSAIRQHRTRAARFFTPVEQTRRTYRIVEALRSRCVFAQHNLTKDPPSRI